MLYLILTVVLILGAVVAFLVGQKAIAAGVGVALLLLTVFSSFTSVEARSVAIQTSFGKYDQTLAGGVHFIAPWADTESFDTTIQTVDLADEFDDVSPDGGRVQVAFKGGGQGWINATVRWAMKEEGAYALWQRYRTFESARSSLVAKSARDAIINVANDYAPNEARADQAALAGKIKGEAAAAITGYGVTVDSVSILSVPLDEKTQATLDAIVAAENNVARARSEQDRARIDSETAKIREASGAVSPALNQRYCLDIANSWDVAKNGPLPATFDCNLAGGAGAPVIVGGR